MGWTRIVVTVVAVLVVAAYAALLAVVALVLDPLAAVPGTPLPDIYRHLERQGFDTRADVVGVLVQALIGVGLALLVAVVTLVRRTPAHFVAAWMLAVVAAGAVAVFASGFQLGMDVADGYGVGGEDHTVWSGVLYWCSLVALVGVPVVLVLGERRWARRVASGTRPV